MQTYTHDEVFYVSRLTHDPPTELKAWLAHSEVVPEWMNGAHGHESLSRVSLLVDKCRLVQRDIDAYEDHEVPISTFEGGISRPIPDHVNHVLRNQEEVVKILTGYVMCHGVEHEWDGSIWSLPLVPDAVPGEFILQRQCYLKDGIVIRTQIENATCVVNPVGEGSIVVRIMILARSGDLGRLRQCRLKECSRWFYARRSNEVYCPGKQCRYRDYLSSPEKGEMMSSALVALQKRERLQVRLEQAMEASFCSGRTRKTIVTNR